ncbi:MAG: cob(I)yrinic acid a,c-diamide adenosyltransferase [Polyangiaceae bacterium]|nr:cob(I)yrinic acid a,c-diamide adenosyltransferase [Polyangiaceae bacterium]
MPRDDTRAPEGSEAPAGSTVAGYREPRLAINRVYTRSGDDGTTALVGGSRVAKTDPRIEAYGTVDELNAVIGAARVSLAEVTGRAPELASLDVVLLRVQHELFNLGSLLATPPDDVHPAQPRVTPRDVAALEQDMDVRLAELAPLRSFVLPGGCRLNADLHLGRTVCRRAERRCAPLGLGSEDALVYLNRLSDALFVWSRWASAKLGVPECLWEPNRASSGG